MKETLGKLQQQLLDVQRELLAIKSQQRQRSIKLWKVLFAVTILLGLFSSLGVLIAGGIPSFNPLVYSGYLEEKGVPVIGKRRVILSLWDHQTPTTSKTPLCSMDLSKTSNSEVLFVRGRFKIALSSVCVLEVRKAAKPLWVQLQIYSADGKASQTLTRARIGSVPRAVHGVPVGTVIAYAGPKDKLPGGWKLCNGDVLKSATFPALYEAIGIAHGYGNGKKDPKTGKYEEFRLPDYQGRFLRGVGHGTNYSVARDQNKSIRTAMNPGGNTGTKVGSIQTDSTRKPRYDALKGTGSTSSNGAHSHPQRYCWVKGHFSPSGWEHVPFVNRSCTNGANTGSVGSHQHSVSVTINNGGDKETRPVNAYVNFIIKY